MNPRVLVIAATAAAAVLYYLAFGGTNLLLDCGLFALFLGFACGIATSRGTSSARAESPHQAILREEAEWMQAHLAARKEREP